MRTATVFAPGHLTGLFQICDQSRDPLEKGARGSGVSIDLGTTTRVISKPARKTDYNIFINGRISNEAIVSEKVIGHYLSQLDLPVFLNIAHKIDTPITAGFGSSGGGALSLSLALNHVLNMGYNRIEAAQVAHLAEIECQTGLGSVYAAEVGGFGVLTKPGAPGIGKSISYDESDELRVIYVYYGSIPTKDALSDPDLRRKINQMGGNFVDELTKELTPERFIRFSRNFTDHVGIATPRLTRLFDHMDSEGYTFTMAMFGEVAFTVLPVEEVENVLLSLSKIINIDPVVTRIDEKGTRFI